MSTCLDLALSKQLDKPRKKSILRKTYNYHNNKKSFTSKDLLSERIVHYYISKFYYTDKPCSERPCKDTRTTYGAAFGRHRPPQTLTTDQYRLLGVQCDKAEKDAWAKYVNQETNEHLRHYYTPLGAKEKPSVCIKVPEPPKVPKPEVDFYPDVTANALATQLCKLKLSVYKDLDETMEDHIYRSSTRISKSCTSAHWAVQKVRKAEEKRLKDKQDFDTMRNERERQMKIAIASNVSEAKIERDRLWDNDLKALGEKKRKYLQKRPIPLDAAIPTDYDRLYPYGKSLTATLGGQAHTAHRCVAARRHFPADTRLGWLLCENPEQHARRG